MGPKTNGNKNKCQQKSNVNQKQMSTKNKCQPKTNVNQKQISTKNKCQPKTNCDNPTQHPTQLQLNPIQSNFNPGWGYTVIGLNHPPPHHAQTFNPVPGNLEQ